MYFEVVVITLTVVVAAGAIVVIGSSYYTPIGKLCPAKTVVYPALASGICCSGYCIFGSEPWV